MATSRSTRVIEWLLVAAIIGVILALSAVYYTRLAGEVRRLSFEITAKNFLTGVAAVRAYTYVHRNTEELERGIELYSVLPGSPYRADPEAPTRVYVNQYGWPAAGDPTKTQEPSVEACVQLWHGLLHRPPKASVTDLVHGEYQVSLTEQGLCRYQPGDLRRLDVYFEYSPETGAVILGTKKE